MGLVKKNKKGTLAHIAPALFPRAMFAAVPKSPPPPRDPPLRKPIQTAILKAGYVATGDFGFDAQNDDISDDDDYQLPYSPINLDDTDVVPMRERLATPPESDNVSEDISSASEHVEVEGLIRTTENEPTYASINKIIVQQISDDSWGDEPLSVPVVQQCIDKSVQVGDSFKIAKLTSNVNDEELRVDNETLRRQMDQLKKENERFQRMVRDLEERLRLNQMEISADDSRDSMIRLRDERIVTLTEQVQMLHQEKLSLMDANRKLTSQIAAAQKASLQNTNSSSGYLKQQLQDMAKEVDTLKSVIHRLNVEMSRYQATHRPPSSEDSKGLPFKGPTPSWLVDHHYLSPLLLAYDDKIKEKDKAIRRFDLELQTIKKNVEEQTSENRSLFLKSQESLPVPSTEWHQLQEQAKLVLEENQVLVEQVDVLQNKSQDMHCAHVQEVTRLTKRLVIVEADRKQQEDDVADLRHQLATLKQCYDDELAENDQKMPINQHLNSVADLKKTFEELKEKSKADVENFEAKLLAISEEKEALMKKILSLETEVKTKSDDIQEYERKQKVYAEKVAILKKQTDHAKEKGSYAREHLQTVLQIAEQAAFERDTYAQVARNQKQEKEKAVNKIMEDSIIVGQFKEQMKHYKNQAHEKIEKASRRLLERSHDHENNITEYKKEFIHLQSLIDDKDETINILQNKIRRIEDELETVWKTATSDNNRMKDLLNKKLRHDTPCSDEINLLSSEEA